MSEIDWDAIGVEEPRSLQWSRRAQYGSEAESCAALDDLLDLRLFDVWTEVQGEYRYARPDDVTGRRPRIDRVLFPTSTARAQGWPFEAIGIECKSGRQAIGPTIAQAMDYTRAEFAVGGLLDRVFVWPACVHGGALGSVMYQHRLGTVEPAYGSGLRWRIGAGRFEAWTGGAELKVRGGRPATRAGAR